MREFNLKYLVSVEVSDKELCLYPDWRYIREKRNLFGRIVSKEGWYKKKPEGYRYIPDLATFRKEPPEGYVSIKNKLYLLKNKVLLYFIDGSYKVIQTETYNDAIKLRDEIIELCADNFIKLK